MLVQQWPDDVTVRKELARGLIVKLFLLAGSDFVDHSMSIFGDLLETLGPEDVGLMEEFFRERFSTHAIVAAAAVTWSLVREDDERSRSFLERIRSAGLDEAEVQRVAEQANLKARASA